MKKSDLLKELEKYPEIKKTLLFAEPTEQFEYLLSLKKQVPVELYAFYARVIFQCDTDEVENKLIMSVFEGLSKDMIMTDIELEAFQNLPKEITIYRGTTRDEETPRVSWSLDKKIADRFNQGRLFVAKIKKSDILAYFKSAGEEEIVVCLRNECEYSIT